MSKRGRPDDEVDDDGGGKPKALTAQEKEDFDMAMGLQELENTNHIDSMINNSREGINVNPVSSFAAAAATGASASICMSAFSSSTSAHHLDDISPPRVLGGSQPNAVMVTPKYGNSYIVTLPFGRESVGTVSAESSLLRITAAEEKVLKERYPPDRVYTYPQFFLCDQVNKDDVRNAKGYKDLLKALEDGLPELEIPSIDGKKPLVGVVVVNLARFGRDEAQLRDVMDDLKKAANGKFDVDIFALDCFGLTEESIPVLGGYYVTMDDIERKYGPHDNPGKYEVPSEETKEEREAVATKVPIIKLRMEAGNKKLKQMIKNGIEKSAELSNTIFTPSGLAEFERKYIMVAKEIKDSDLEGEQMKSFIGEKVKELAQLVTEYTGQPLTAMLFRRSTKQKGDRDSILAFGSVPAEQFAYGYADLEFLRNVPDTGELVIYFDDQRNRDQVTNPQYILYLAAVLSGAIRTAVISEPNRISRSRWLVELHQQACTLRNTAVIYSKAIGKCVATLAFNEEMGKLAREEANLERIQTIDGFRKKLPMTADPNKGFVVTSELSGAMEFVGSCNLTQNELGVMELAGISKLNQNEQGE